MTNALTTATVAGVAWSYVDTSAKGPALIMLPGSVGTCEMFFRQIRALGDTYRLISVSYPAEPDPTRLADGLAGLMDHLQLDRASVLGSSFGGYWAQFFALRHAGRVEHLFLGNIFITPNELFSNPLFDPAWIAKTAPADLQAFWLERVEKAPDSELKAIQRDMLSGRQSADNLKARFVGVARATLCPPLPLPAQSITVIDCDDDPIIPPQSRQAVRDRYPGAAIRTLSSGGHYPHILNPEAYDTIITERLSS
ncbi:pimeloyl-ACP methyl ester carboxylesterase [Pseudorhodoplanes sinuspersici]|nr:pimeloyl-ACP methyl ester carboxylesterase [Pseudorhodoplanes sinuspersici]